MNSLRAILLSLLVLAVAGSTAYGVDVTFQVWMAFQQEQGNFDPDNDLIVVRGSFNGWAGNDWALEVVQGDENGLYRGTFDVGEGDYEYKFVIAAPGGDTWEGVDNRRLQVGNEAVILDPVWFNNQEPVELTSVEVLFQVNMAVAVDGGLFDPANDAVIIRGGHANLGNWGGFNRLERVGATDIYANWIQFEDVPEGSAIEYKFVIDDDGDDQDPVTWEELPQGGNRRVTPTGDEADEDDNGFGEIMLEPVYFADNPGNVQQDLTVFFHCNTYAAWARFEEEGIEGVEEIEGFWIAGLGDIVGWNWGGLPDEARLRDDGEAPDLQADDHIYAVSILFPEGTPRNQIYKYGINMLDNEAGFGENHFVLLEENAEEMVVVDTFGTNGHMYDPWLSVREIEPPFVPREFVVEQNFPNPFNSATAIAFSLPERSDVAVRLFNLAGQELFNYNAGTLNAGRYEITLEAHNLAAGAYIYRLEAGAYSASKRLILLK